MGTLFRQLTDDLDLVQASSSSSLLPT